MCKNTVIQVNNTMLNQYRFLDQISFLIDNELINKIDHEK